MDDLVLDAESLFNIADIIDGYCAKQREVVNGYHAQIMALESEWRDDETFGTMVQELNALKTQAIAILDEVYETYPKYFRKRAQQILERPVYHSDSPTVTGGSRLISGGGNKTSAKKSTLTEESSIDEIGVFDSVEVGPIGVNNETKTVSVETAIARNLSVTAQTWDKYSYVGGEVYDTPAETGRSLDCDQGKVPGYRNTCGVVSCVNVARLAGLFLEEFEVLDIAIKNDLCNKYKKGWFGKIHQGGGTSPKSRKEILKHLGIDSYLEDASIENIAKRVTEGRGVIISVRAGKLWNTNIKGLHAVTVTSVQRGFDGAIQGFFICDSGRHVSADAWAFYNVSEIQAALKRNRPMNVTTNIIR